MASARGYPTVAIALALAAAFLWATYYLFVLWLAPGTAASATLVFPFLFGGLAYSLWAVSRGHGGAWLRLWSSPMAYLRIALLVGMQVSVLATTYLAGPVDSALLSLIGDVVVTPIIVAYLLGIGRAHVHTSLFAAGLLLSVAGGALTIVAGQSLVGLRTWEWLVVPAVPLTVAFFFLLTARENQTTAPPAVVGQSMLAAGLVTVALAPLIPGGWPGLAVASAEPLLLLALCGLTSFFVAPAIYFLAIERAGLIVPPMLMTGIPVFTLVLSAGVLGIALPWIGVAGIPVAVLGAILALRGETSNPAPDGAASN
jgi:drug/metabolite transporter (DMT)-like permease